jgi:predicted metal-dependent hydrolase
MPRRRKPPIIEKRDLDIDGRIITYSLRRSFQARRLRLEIGPNTGLTVVVPHSYSLRHLPDFLKARKRWISRQFTRLDEEKTMPPPKQLEVGTALPYMGRQLVLVKQEKPRGHRVSRQDDKLIVQADLFSNSLLEPALERWYRAEAAVIITGIADRLGSRIGIGYRRIVIRAQKTRWASCSRNKSLSFNWKLIMAPEPVIEYVVIHELLHLKEMNHSEKFWELVARHCPRWREHKKWLKQHESDLTTRLRAPSPPPAAAEQLRLI